MRNNEERLGVQQHQQSELPPQFLQQSQNPVAQPQLSFVAPTEFVDLPSKGKFYPEGHPLKNKSTLEIKQMTAKEEDVLTNRSFLKKGVALEKLLESIILDRSVNPQDLLICDRNAVFVAARISGYGAEYVTQIQCPSCEKKAKNKFNLLEKAEEWVEETAASVEVSPAGTFKLVLPSTKWVVECRALTGADEKRLLGVLTSKSKEDFTLMDQLKMLVVSIQGVTDRAVVQQALEVMPAADSKYLRKEYDKAIPSLNLKNNFNCKECDHEEVLEVPLTADFFWPK